MHGACTVSFEGGILIIYSYVWQYEWWHVYVSSRTFIRIYINLCVYVLATKFNRNNTFALACTHHRILSNLGLNGTQIKYSQYWPWKEAVLCMCFHSNTDQIQPCKHVFPANFQISTFFAFYYAKVLVA